MIPLMVGFLLMGPISGWLSDRYGARLFSTGGMLIQAVCFYLLTILPLNFDYMWFWPILFMLGIGQGMFSSPNTSSIMGSVPPDQRGVASGMRATFQNSGTLVSIGVFFSLITAGLAATLGTTLFTGLINSGLPAVVAAKIAHLPPTSALFAAFLGYNPMASLIPDSVLQALPAAKQATLLGHSYFPNLISPPFAQGLHNVFYLSAVMCLVAAFVSLMRGKQNHISQEVVSKSGSVDTAKQQAAVTSDMD